MKGTELWIALYPYREHFGSMLAYSYDLATCRKKKPKILTTMVVFTLELPKALAAHVYKLLWPSKSQF